MVGSYKKSEDVCSLSPGRVGGEDWQSESFSGGVFIERKASEREREIRRREKRDRQKEILLGERNFEDEI